MFFKLNFQQDDVPTNKCQKTQTGHRPQQTCLNRTPIQGPWLPRLKHFREINLVDTSDDGQR